MNILIPSSKTDVYRKGKTLYLAKQRENLSVFKLLESYMEKAGLKFGQNRFLIGEIKNDGEREVLNGRTKLPYGKFLEIIKEKADSIGLDPTKYATHSGRSGGATALATRVTPFELMVSGRWRDPRSLNSYVELCKERRLDISKELQM